VSELDPAIDWATRFGLAIAPLFERDGDRPPGSHSVLLDGVSGTFAMSVTDDELWRTDDPAHWAWSSDIPHHITVTPTKVAVVRWDRASEPRVFGRESIERSLDRFYGFLLEDRLRSNRTVVEHLLGFFRRLRSLAHAARLPDTRATDLFTASLARLLAHESDNVAPSEYGLADDANELITAVDKRGFKAILQEVEQASGTMSWLRLHPSLAVRHAGGQLFQEAHFELLRGATDFDLFGLVGISEVSPTNRGGTHFTPPTLARSLVEQALFALSGPLDRRDNLTLCDPACGSGAFLHEAIRALRRSGFKGRLRLIGYDISPAAISMARFVVASALRDWTPRGGVEVELRAGDSLGELGMPNADVVVMNPPFVGFAAQTGAQRDQLSAALGATTAGRGDYSMAFVLRSLEALNAGGVLGTLFPASLLSLKAASAWRERLLDLADIRFLGSIGDFGLFSHALVQVAAAVFSKEHHPDRELVALVTENDPLATSVALRQLRRSGSDVPPPAVLDSSWSLFPVPVTALRGRPTWRLPTPGAERILKSLSQTGLPSIGDLFEISQGIQTGLNSALLLNTEQLHRLHPKERRYFRQATMTDSIQNGRIARPYWVFFPHSTDGPVFRDETQLRKAVPSYFAEFLEPNRERLKGRATIIRSHRPDWWGLMEPRRWSLLGRPRIITKFFGAEGAFAGDYESEYFAVMGHVWTLKKRGSGPLSSEDEGSEQLTEQEVLAAFVALCNSELFIRLVALYAPHVAGGQFDLSSRHVAPIPVPDLQLLSLDPEAGRLVRELARLGREVDVAKSHWREDSNRLAERLYGGIDLDAI
jgi:adenine-specific DNA-methyltransferase